MQSQSPEDAWGPHSCAARSTVRRPMVTRNLFPVLVLNSNNIELNLKKKEIILDEY